jgi:hypothetical protein
LVYPQAFVEPCGQFKYVEGAGVRQDQPVPVAVLSGADFAPNICDFLGEVVGLRVGLELDVVIDIRHQTDFPDSAHDEQAPGYHAKS